jgi:hypothetical protein
MSSCVAGQFSARFVDLKLAAELRQVLDPLVATISEVSTRDPKVPAKRRG